MTEQSFPVIEQPMTDDQWKSVTLGIGDGILDEGGSPYSLSLSNQTDQVTIGVDNTTGFAHAILRGFYHKMDAPIALPVPAVSEKTTYSVALRYDPTDTELPIRLGAWTTLDRSNGKAYLLLWQITRQPNQLLSDSTRKSFRQRVTPVIQVDTEANLPDASTVLWGTRAFCWAESMEFRASWSKWRPVGSWRTDPLPMGGWEHASGTGGISVTPCQGGNQYAYQGVLIRRAETYTLSGSSTAGTFVPASMAPHRDVWVVGTVSGKSIQVCLKPNGTLIFEPLDGQQVRLAQTAGISFTLNWFRAVDPNSTS